MDDVKRNELEAIVRHVLREHQHEGLHMIGGVDQLVNRLVGAVGQWLEGGHLASRKTA